MGLRGETIGRVLRHAVALLLLLACVLGVTACKRDPGGQLPAASGEAIQARREAVTGFALLRAYPDQGRDDLAIAVEFSRPLVGTQEFDKLLTFAEKVGEGSSWTLSDDGKILRYPHVPVNSTVTLRVSGALTAADGSKLGRDQEL